jgi:hypothetical protein
MAHANTTYYKLILNVYLLSLKGTVNLRFFMNLNTKNRIFFMKKTMIIAPSEFYSIHSSTQF